MLLRSLIFTGFIQGLFFIFLLKTKVKNSLADRVLMLWMVIVAAQLLFYYDNLAAVPVFPPVLQLLTFALPLLSSPILYFYIRALSFVDAFKWNKTYFHVLPYLVFNGLTFWLEYTQKGALYLKDGYPHFDATLPLGLVYFLTVLLAVVPGYYAVLGLFVLSKHQRSLPDNYSYTEKINLNWLKWITIGLLGLFIGLFLLIKYGIQYGLVTDKNLFAVVGAVLTVYVFLVGIGGLRQHTILQNVVLKKVAIVPPTYRNGLSDEKINALFAQLKLHMEQQQPFLQEDLSLTMLAQQLSITPNQLSQVINQLTKANFFYFINSYRVAAVKAKLKDPALAHYSILGIAYACGFSSKSAFNKIFKELTGKTPLQYQKDKN